MKLLLNSFNGEEIHLGRMERIKYFHPFWNIFSYLGRMDSVEDQGEDQRQDEGQPASKEKVGDGNTLSPDVQICASHNCQDSQAEENIIDLILQLD